MSRGVYVLPVVAVLFFVGFIHNAVTGELTAGDTIAQWIAIPVCGGAFAFIRHEAREHAAFRAYLASHIDEVRAGTATWRGHPISYATRVRTYHVVISLLVVSLRIPVRASLERDVGLRAGCAVVTLLLGWWGFPWGPIWTVKTLANNVRGKPETSIGELIEGAAIGLGTPRAIARDHS